MVSPEPKLVRLKYPYFLELLSEVVNLRRSAIELADVEK